MKNFLAMLLMSLAVVMTPLTAKADDDRVRYDPDVVRAHVSHMLRGDYSFGTLNKPTIHVFTPQETRNDIEQYIEFFDELTGSGKSIVLVDDYKRADITFLILKSYDEYFDHEEVLRHFYRDEKNEYERAALDWNADWEDWPEGKLASVRVSKSQTVAGEEVLENARRLKILLVGDNYELTQARILRMLTLAFFDAKTSNKLEPSIFNTQPMFGDGNISEFDQVYLRIMLQVDFPDSVKSGDVASELQEKVLQLLREEGLLDEDSRI